jgi:hypothetical protein
MPREYSLAKRDIFPSIIHGVITNFAKISSLLKNIFVINISISENNQKILSPPFRGYAMAIFPGNYRICPPFRWLFAFNPEI